MERRMKLDWNWLRELFQELQTSAFMM